MVREYWENKLPRKFLILQLWQWLSKLPLSLVVDSSQLERVTVPALGVRAMPAWYPMSPRYPTSPFPVMPVWCVMTVSRRIFTGPPTSCCCSKSAPGKGFVTKKFKNWYNITDLVLWVKVKPDFPKPDQPCLLIKIIK